MVRHRLALAAALSFASLALPSVSLAQPAAQNDPVKEVARQRYQDGVKAFDAGKWEEARAAFAQAYALSGAPAVLLNLGLAETKAGKTVEGGNHLIKFLRDHKEATPENKTSALAAIDDCKKKAAYVSITVDVPGADVVLDGVAMGKSPLPDPVFVEPGARVATATANGKTGTTKLEAIRGQAATIAIVTNPTTAPPPVDPNPPIGQLQPLPPQNPPPFQPVMPLPNQPQPDSGGESFGQWYTHKPLAWVGTGLFAVGLGFGIGFTVAANQSADDSETIANTIRNKAKAEGVDGPPCGPEDGSGAGDVYPSACNQLRDALGVHQANVAVAVTGWVVGGLAAAGTVTYMMVDWYAGSRKAKSGSTSAVGFAPIVSPDAAGGFVFGTF